MSDEMRDVVSAIDGVKTKAREITDFRDVEAFAKAVTHCLDTIYSALDQLKHRHEHGIRE